MIEPAENRMAESANDLGLSAVENEPHRHRLGAGLGAVLAGGAAGATGGVLVGPVGAIVGAVVGAVAGGLGGCAVAEMVDQDMLDDGIRDTYTTRIPSRPAADAMDADANFQRPNSKPAPRESWNRLDESGKDLLIDDPPVDDV